MWKYLFILVGMCGKPCEPEIIYYPNLSEGESLVINSSGVGGNMILNLDSTFVVRSGFYGSGEPYLMITKK